MRIHSFDIYQYSLPLVKPLSVRGTVLHQRDGLIIHLKNENGIEGFGEIAPLSGYSNETFEQALAQVKRLQSALSNQSLPEKLEDLNGRFNKWLNEYKLKPSVQMGMEMAVLNLLANAKKIPVHHLVGKDFHDQVRVSALLQGSRDEVKKQAQNLLAAGYTSMKLKVGAEIEEDIARVKAVSEVVEGRALLHLDANQTWDLNKAVHLIDEIGLTTVNYIEEPFKDLTNIPEFFMKTTMPVALDESLQTTHFENFKSIDGLDILILKPTMLGGVEKTWGLIDKAKRVGLEVVISSSFESGIGILFLTNLAGCTHRESYAGVDTLKWFGEDILKEKIAVNHGKIDISQRRIGSQDVRFDLLKPIP